MTTTIRLLPMMRIQLRTSWRATATWILALTAMMVGTTWSISGLYDTQAKIDSYADALGGTGALMLINGRVFGIDSLGGVISNEFGFVASFALPLMGISLIARSTRREEETGRLELLVAGRIGRTAPLVSAVLVASGALAVTSVALCAGLVAVGVPAEPAALYAVSLGALGLVFAAVTVVASHVVEHSRGVYGISLAVLVVSYVLRGTGDVLGDALTWLSPLGWAEQTRPFGDPRWWPLLISLGVTVLLVGVAVRVGSTRDVGAALLHRRGSATTASPTLLRPVGFAAVLHRGTVISWALGGIVVCGMFGLLSQQIIEASAKNPSLATALDGSGGTVAGSDGATPVLAMCVLLLALVCSGYVVQAVGTLKAEEGGGRLEPILAGSTSRTTWLAVHACTVLAGLVVVAGLGALTLAATVAWSTGSADRTGALVRGTAAYLPAVLVVGGLALASLGIRPRAFGIAWIAFAFTAVVAFLGAALRLPQWIRDLAPTQHVGYPPQGSTEALPLVILAVITAGLTVAAIIGFRRRSIPQV